MFIFLYRSSCIFYIDLAVFLYRSSCIFYIQLYFSYRSSCIFYIDLAVYVYIDLTVFFFIQIQLYFYIDLAVFFLYRSSCIFYINLAVFFIQIQLYFLYRSGTYQQGKCQGSPYKFSFLQLTIVYDSSKTMVLFTFDLLWKKRWYYTENYGTLVYYQYGKNYGTMSKTIRH